MVEVGQLVDSGHRVVPVAGYGIIVGRGGVVGSCHGWRVVVATSR